MSTIRESELVQLLCDSPFPTNLGPAGISGEVREYCLTHNISDACRATSDLARDQLPHGSTVALSLEGDGESDEQTLIVHLGIKAPPEEVFRLFDRFVDAWIDRVPTQAQHKIGLTYSAV
jgi:hypothetical protein